MPFDCTQSSHESVPKEKAQYQTNSVWWEIICDMMSRRRQCNLVNMGGSTLRNVRRNAAALKQEHVRTGECALRIRLSAFIFIPLRSSSLNYASSNYTVSAEMYPLYEIRPPCIFITNNNPIYKKISQCCSALE